MGNWASSGQVLMGWTLNRLSQTQSTNEMGLNGLGCKWNGL